MNAAPHYPRFAPWPPAIERAAVQTPEHRGPHQPAPARQRRYQVSIAKPDGTVIEFSQLAFHSVDLASDAMDLGGLGAAVRIQALPALEAA